jgi:O-antigen/teichoic acid export membrane protein
LIRASIVILTVYFYKDAYFAIWGLAAFYLLKYCILLLYLFLNYRDFLRSFDAGLVREQLKYALPFGAGVIVGQIANKMDRIIVSSMIGLSKFASYSVASFRIPLLGMLYDSIYNVAIPKLSEYSSKGDRESARLLLKKIIVKTSMVTIPVLIFFELHADLIIVVLFTEKYVDSIMPFRIIILAMLFQMMAKGLILRAFNKTTVQFKIALVMLFVSVAFGIILTYALGIIGAAAAFVITIGTSHILTFIEEVKILKIRFWERLPINDLGYILIVSFLCLLPTIPIILYKEEIGYILSIVCNVIIYFSVITYFLHRRSYINISLDAFKLRRLSK